MNMLQVETLTNNAFAPFGRVLGRPPDDPNATREDLDAWLGMSDIYGMEALHPVWSFLEVKRSSMAQNQLERHLQAAEAFVPLQGNSVLMVAPATHEQDPTAGPDENAIRAFLLDGRAGVFLPKGVWHWAPFPIGETATFLLLMDRDILDDIEIREIATRHYQL